MFFSNLVETSTLPVLLALKASLTLFVATCKLNWALAPEDSGQLARRTARDAYGRTPVIFKSMRYTLLLAVM